MKESKQTISGLNKSLILKHKSIISYLREKYPGKWIYRGHGYWEHIGKGMALQVAILGGFNGDDYCGSELIYYPKNGTPERVF
jgi:hypothetical protein